MVNNSKPIIILTGLQLTRKAQAVYVGKKRDYGIFSTGDIVRNYCMERGLKPNFNNVKNSAEKMFSQGEDVFLSTHLSAIDSCLTKKKGVIIDSLKSIDGVEYLKSKYHSVLVVGFLASYDFRLEHSKIRSRSDDAKSIGEFNDRDTRELGVGLSELIVFSDYFLIADSVENSRLQFSKILDKIEDGLVL